MIAWHNIISLRSSNFSFAKFTTLFLDFVQNQEEGRKNILCRKTGACDKDRSKCVHHLLEIFTHSTNSVNQTIQDSYLVLRGWMNHTQQSFQLVPVESKVLVFEKKEIGLQSSVM